MSDEKPVYPETESPRGASKIERDLRRRKAMKTFEELQEKHELEAEIFDPLAKLA